MHYWLVGMRGGEKVIEEFCRLYPQADIFTHVAIPENLSDTIKKHRIIETGIARLPGAKKHYQKYLPLMPQALEALDLSGYDLVISSESGPAKGVITGPDTVHVCYCHSPMRYIWDQYHIYRNQAGWLTRSAMPYLAHKLRIWDTVSASRPDHIVANSAFVAKRVAKFWGREADVIHPPVDLEAFKLAQTPPEDFYLTAGELVTYKRADLVINAFNRSGRKLVMIGDGPERERLQASAGPNIQFLGRVSFDVLRDHYARCRALIFPGVEDFGIVPLEVMASGRPVIAYGQGGALETVREGQTGLFFQEDSPAAINTAIDKLEAEYEKFNAATIRAHAEGFSAVRFRDTFSEFVTERMASAT